jgi:hypothetical protein
MIENAGYDKSGLLVSKEIAANGSGGGCPKMSAFVPFRKDSNGDSSCFHQIFSGWGLAPAYGRTASTSVVNSCDFIIVSV